MDVVLGDLGQVKVDHMGELTDVETARGNIGGDQDPDPVGLELFQGTGSLVLLLVAVDGKVYATLGYGKPVSVLDAATGETLLEYEGTEGAHEVVVEGDVVYVSVVEEPAEHLRLEVEASRARLYGRTSEQAKAAAARLPQKNRRRGAEDTGPEKSIVAIRAETGEVLWRKTDATEDLHLNTLTE